MISSEVYFETSLSLDDFSGMLRRVLNLPSKNRTEYQQEQRRESANYGGLYYLFEVLGFQLLLLRNSGEAEIPERPGHSLYVVISGGTEEANLLLAEHVRQVVAREGIPVVRDSLSS